MCVIASLCVGSVVLLDVLAERYEVREGLVAWAAGLARGHLGITLVVVVLVAWLLAM